MASDSAGWQAEKQRIQDEANRKRSEAAKGNDNAAKDREEKTVVPHVVAALNAVPDQPNRSSIAKARASNTDRGTVERMGRLAPATVLRLLGCLVVCGVRHGDHCILMIYMVFPSEMVEVAEIAEALKEFAGRMLV